MKKIFIFIFVFMVFAFGNVYANDFFISDIIVPKVVFEDTNFDVNIVVVNTDAGQGNIDINLQLYSPKGDMLWSYELAQQIVPANSSLSIQKRITPTDTNASNASHLVWAIITTIDDNPTNNISQKWFIITQKQKKTPIPDMPIYFGFVIALIAIIFLINKKEKR